MPKFSAYMRGEKGAQGETGQASLLDGYISITEELPQIQTLDPNKNHVYYVQKEDGIHLFISEHGERWQDLGVATAGFSTQQYATASTKEWYPNVQPNVTITPHDNQQTTGLKSFDFHFNIPESQPAGFSTNQPTSVSTLDWDKAATAEIVVNENSPDYDKSFLFKFGIPHGREAGFSTHQNVSTSIVSWTSEAKVSISTDENSPFYEKVFNYNFEIPQGEPAGFGTLSTEIDILNHLSTATFDITEGGTNREKDLTFKLGIPAAHPAGFSTVSATSYDLNWDKHSEASVSTEGNDWEKNFDFSFGIPHGRPAGFAEEMGVSVTTLPSQTIKNKKDSIIQLEKTEYNKAEIKNIKIDIEPVQDLHGYDNPWPAGGSKNILRVTAESATINGIQWTVDKDAGGNVVSITANGTSIGRSIFPLWFDYAYLSDYGFNGDYILSGTASNNCRIMLQAEGSGNIIDAGSSVQFSTESLTQKYRFVCEVPSSGTTLSNAKIYPMVRLASDTDATYVPYSNICPITGHTQAVVTRTGKNLINIPQSPVTINGITFTPHEDGSITVNGTSIAVADFVIIDSRTLINFGNATASFAIEVFGYSISGPTLNFQNDFYDGSTYLGTLQSGNNNKTKTFSGTNLNIRSSRIRIQSGQTFSNLVIKPMMVIGSTAPTEFAPYSGTSITIDLDGTRYGGVVDVTNGTLTVDRKGFRLPTDVTWSKSTSFPGGYFRSASTFGLRQQTPFICSHAKTVSSTANYILGTCLCDNSINFRLLPPDSTLEDWYDYITNNEIYVVGYLAEPFTVTLTPQQLSLLLGDNNVWADTGDIDIDYSIVNDAYVTVSPDDSTPDYAKKFDFEFGIPNGVPGGFGNISVSTVQLEPNTPASVSITTSGPESAKNFDFLFKIPKGNKGDQGDALGTYLGIEFTSTQVDSTKEVYWVGNTLHIKRGINKKVPIYILNSENNNIAATFEINENEILHNADLPFDGILYLIAASNIPRFQVNSYTSLPYGEEPTVEAYYPNPSDPSIVYLDFKLPKGVKGDSALAINQVNVIPLEDKDDIPYATVSTDSNSQVTMTFYLPRGLDGADGAQGPKGDSALTIDSINVYALSTDATPYAQTINQDGNITIDFYLPKGIKGDQGDIGVGISSINNLGTIGLTTTYQINYTSTNIAPTTFEVINGSKGDQGEPGKGITSINNLGTIGLTTTYQVNYGEGLNTTFEIVNGKQGPQGEQGIGIKSILKTNTDEITREDTYTITFTDNSTTTYIIKNGEKGDKGDTALTISNISITTLAEGETNPHAEVTTDANHDVSIEFHLPKGATGTGISSITKGQSEGLIDNYIINYDNGTTTGYQITNGNGISSITTNGSNGLIDNYIINYDNGTSTTFQVINGNGINSITFDSLSETGNIYNINYSNGAIDTILAPKGPQGPQGIPGNQGNQGVGISSIEYIDSEGLQDNYRINYTNNNFFDFTITNGAVVGDIRSIVYTTTDPGANTSLTTGNIILVYEE